MDQLRNSPPAQLFSGDGRTVAIVHGRDLEAFAVIEALLRRLGLQPFAFDAALMRTAGLPTTLDAVRHLFAGVQAVIVLFTPDDLAMTHSTLKRPDGTPVEVRYSGQPRQNVLIETGMAISALPAQTILVRIGQIRVASDLHGVNILNFDGNIPSVRRLTGRLVRAGCTIPIEHVDHPEAIQLQATLARIQQRETEPTYSRREVSIFDAARRSGLMDIENRTAKGDLALPPEAFYDAATEELAISGVSTYQTFNQHDDNIGQLLSRGIGVRILMLSPVSDDVDRLSAREKRPILDDIKATLRTIRRNGFDQHPGFEIRFMPFSYPFTAVMIDGNINGISSDFFNPDADFNARAEIRVQPAGYYITQHLGPVLHFRCAEERGPFHHFATDLRRQWETAITRVDPRIREMFDEI